MGGELPGTSFLEDQFFNVGLMLMDLSPGKMTKGIYYLIEHLLVESCRRVARYEEINELVLEEGKLCAENAHDCLRAFLVRSKGLETEPANSPAAALQLNSAIASLVM